LAAAGAKTQATQTNGDGTARSEVFDILRRKNWPAPYDFRAIRNDLHRALENDIAGLKAHPDDARATYDAGVVAGDFSRAHATVGEAVGLIADIPSAQTLMTRITQQAQALLSKPHHA
jgi:nitronate monooxygenase